MREFVLYSRLGRTDSKFPSLRKAGRLDIVHECIVSSLFLSHALRRNVVFHAVLSGPPLPPLHLKIDGATLHDVRTDQETWSDIFKAAFSGKHHPGISVDRTSFETLLKTMSKQSQIYVLEEGGEDVSRLSLNDHPVFVLGDHIGLPKTAESFALRYGKKISLGKRPYLAASCIAILNYLLDQKLPL